MSENLIEQITEVARAFIVREVGEDAGPMMTEQARAFTDVVWAVVGPELDRLCAEVERLRVVVGQWEHDYPCDGLCQDYAEEDCSRHGRRPAELWHAMGEIQAARDAALAECAVLRARLAKVEALADEWQRACDRGENGRHGYRSAEYGDDYAADVRAALASVPEPSDSEPCTTPGCPGDGRYAAPGRRHVEGCTYPFDDADEWDAAGDELQGPEPPDVASLSDSEPAPCQCHNTHAAITHHLAQDGVALIAAERQRQIYEEGYTRAHDAEHRTAELVAAARAYTWVAVGRFHWARQEWPWGQDSFKPGASGGARRDLVKAGALIAAAIDRLDSEPAPCGHVERVTGCGGCDPGAVEWVRDDGATHWRRPTAGETTLPSETAPDADREAGER